MLKASAAYEMCLVAVQSDGKAIDFVPEQYRTEEVYLEACRNNGLMITKVPDSIISEEFYICAVESNGNTLKYIPLDATADSFETSLPSRGAWIEIAFVQTSVRCRIVAPFTGSVD